MTLFLQQACHDLTVYEVLGTSQADETYFCHKLTLCRRAIPVSGPIL
jgi:hypothetical protein